MLLRHQNVGTGGSLALGGQCSQDLCSCKAKEYIFWKENNEKNTLIEYQYSIQI